MTVISRPSSTEWITTTLREVLTVIRGVTYKKEQAFAKPGPGLLPILRATNIQDNLHFVDLVYVPQRCVSNTQLLRRGDIVVAASSGSRNVVGKAAQLTTNWHGSFGAFCFGLRPKNGADPDFLSWFLQTSEYRHRVAQLAAGVNINNLRATHIEDTPVKIPPLSEQKRIVEEIEKQLTRLEAATTALKRVQVNLKRYRAAVLKSACEGQLVPTESELARSPARYETGLELLSRILALRGSERTLHASAKAAERPRLPDGWTWTTAGELFECIVPNRDKPKAFTGDVPWITLPALSDQVRIDRARSDRGLTKEEIRTYKARVIPAGSIVMSCIGRFGLAGVLTFDAVVNQQLHAFVIPAFLPAEYFAYALRSQKSYMERVATSTTIAYLNKRNCNSIPIALPPLTEQHRIVAEVERRLSIIDELQRVVETNLQCAKNLRQSILHRAFSGNL